jgi:hypothetical protein
VSLKLVAVAQYIKLISFRRFLEAIRDPKTWVMAFFAGSAYVPESFFYPPIKSRRLLRNIVNSVRGNQITRIYILTHLSSPISASWSLHNSASTISRPLSLDVSMEWSKVCHHSELHCTPLIYSCGTVLAIWLGVTLASQILIGRSYSGVLMYIPAILGAILVSALPFSNKVGLLFSYWISSTFSWPLLVTWHDFTLLFLSLVFAIAPFPIFLGWVSSIISGHTKRMGGFFLPYLV